MPRVTTREQLAEVAARRDPAEWLRVLLHESTRANNAEDVVALYKEALRVATEAFAQYALGTNAPPAEAVDGFVEGFIQQAQMRRLRGG